LVLDEVLDRYAGLRPGNMTDPPEELIKTPASSEFID
jgi:hypothetical protein